MEVRLGERLTLDDVLAVARNGARVALPREAAGRVRRAREVVDRLVAAGRAVYGVTTGVGELAGVAISADQAAALQLNIVRSHAAGVGPPLPPEAVRAMMLLRAHALALGHSGVRLEVLETLLAMLNANVLPVIPEQGSVGASGDLAPLAHLALALIGEGRVLAADGDRAAADALAEAGLAPLRLGSKEGVALINGTQMMTAIGALALARAETLARDADVAGAMTAEALLALPEAYDEELQRARPQRGQQASAANLRRLLAGTRLERPAGKVQDAYALRCLPQVHGAARDGIAFARGVIETEINSATDNPLIFPQGERVLSGGNFHGQPVALAMDVLAIAAATVGTISERRIERLVNPHLSGLPAFLTADGGLHSGLMLAQYTAAALVSENKILSHPASVDSIPTSANQEDHVSMGSIAARKAARVVAHAEQVVAIEALCAAQALEFRSLALAAPAVRAAHRIVREAVPPLGPDRVLADDLARVKTLVASGALLTAVRDTGVSLE